jgi:hypothetical protein
MKKVMLTIAGMLMIGMAAVNAQVDTTRAKTPTYELNNQVPKSYVLVTSDEIPATLKTTLQESEYYGWEKGSFYQNKGTNEYLVRIGDPNA